MPEHATVEVDDGTARITFANNKARGAGLDALVRAGGPRSIRTDTSGPKPTYIVAETVATDAGLVDKPRPRRKRKPKTEPAEDTTDTDHGAPPEDTVTGDDLTLS